MIIETDDFSYKTLSRGKFCFIPYEKKRLRQNKNVYLVTEFTLFGYAVTLTKQSKPVLWRCRRCAADVIANRCECKESPSPWELKQ